MKRKMILFVSAFFLIGSSATCFAEKAPQSVVDLANSTLAGLGADSVIVNAVNKQNMKGMTLEEIKKQDNQWKSTPGIDGFMEKMLDSECSNHLRNLMVQKTYYAEIFVMDNKGANVCMTDKTSDYWQGDEAKFNKSFAGGSGAVFVDDVEFDESSQAYLSQVSVPVKDNGKVIGAITFGIDIDKIE